MPVRGIRKLAEVFTAQMRRGAIRNGDAEMMARMVIGVAWHAVLLDNVLPPEGRAALAPTEEYVDAAMDLMWDGIHPLGPEGEAPKKKRERKKR
jgi:hypothetical protein